MAVPSPAITSPFARARALIAALWPEPVRVNGRERLRSLAGAAVGVLVAGVLCRWLAAGGEWSAWLVAPIGASAVLVFALPSSPLAQPWSVIGGNTVSCVTASACVLAIPDPVLAGAAAVGLAIAAMFQLRCLHPPGGSTALLIALTHNADFGFALFPVAANSVLLVLAGVAYNHFTGRAYPHVHVQPGPRPPDGSRFSPADLDAALARYNQVIDVSRDDLEALLHDAETLAYARNLGTLRCADVMPHNPVAVQFGTPLEEAWAVMRQQRIKALPVVDRAHRIVGIVTAADFMRHADIDRHEGLGERLRAMVRRIGHTHSERPEVVGQIMTRQVRVASADGLLMALVPLFSEGGHHHIPIIDAEKRLAGIITQTDLVGALYRAASSPA